MSTYHPGDGPKLSAVLGPARRGVRTDRADLLLVPSGIGDKTLSSLVHHHSDPIGAVVSLPQNGMPYYGFFLPPGSDQLPWPDSCAYQPAGTPWVLPRPGDHGDDSRPGWIRYGTGDRLYTKPIPLYAILSSLSEPAPSGVHPCAPREPATARPATRLPVRSGSSA